MPGEVHQLAVLIVVPALLGLGALITGIYLLLRRPPEGASPNLGLRMILAALCLVGALGIGACFGFYGYVFTQLG